MSNTSQTGLKNAPPHFFSFKQQKLLENFPDTSEAINEPNGLLVAGGCVNEGTLISAYKKGIFPWGKSNDLPLWWSPDPRTILYPNEIKISKSLSKTIRRGEYKVTFDKNFEAVIASCGLERGESTWIDEEIVNAYTALHKKGLAHSVECWRDNELCGGLYGVGIGKIFFGESMYSTKRDASKIALAFLCEKLFSWKYQLIDCQIKSAHLTRMGAKNLSKEKFEDILNLYLDEAPEKLAWLVK